MSVTLDAVPWPVYTPRCVLRRPTSADAQAVWAYRRLPEASQWMTSLVNDEEAFVEGFPTPAQMSSMIIVESGGAVVGDLRVTIEDGWGQTEVVDRARSTEAEVGWVFDPAHQGKGLASGAASRMLDLCFDDLGLRRVTAGCFADNKPSWRMMDRLGLRCEGAFTADSLHRDGRWLDSYSYAILREEWAALREERVGRSGWNTDRTVSGQKPE